MAMPPPLTPPRLGDPINTGLSYVQRTSAEKQAGFWNQTIQRRGLPPGSSSAWHHSKAEMGTTNSSGYPDHRAIDQPTTATPSPDDKSARVERTPERLIDGLPDPLTGSEVGITRKTRILASDNHFHVASSHLTGGCPSLQGCAENLDLSGRVPAVGRLRGSQIVDNLSRVDKNISFGLDEHFSAFIEEEVASGRYRSASDVVCAALRLLEDREMRLDAVRRALVAGENSGAPTPFDLDEFVTRKHVDAANTVD